MAHRSSSVQSAKAVPGHGRAFVGALDVRAARILRPNCAQELVGGPWQAPGTPCYTSGQGGLARANAMGQADRSLNVRKRSGPCTCARRRGARGCWRAGRCEAPRESPRCPGAGVGSRVLRVHALAAAEHASHLQHRGPRSCPPVGEGVWPGPSADAALAQPGLGKLPPRSRSMTASPSRRWAWAASSSSAAAGGQWVFTPSEARVSSSLSTRPSSRWIWPIR